MEYAISGVLVAFSALFSGLTLGLMGLDVHELKRKADLGDKEAMRIYPVRKRGNLLLTTLLLGNVAVNAALSIYLGSIASGIVAGIIATGLIVILGEILPQAVFSREAMRLGAAFSPVARVFLFVFYPVAAPVAWILDKLLGEELPMVYSRGELMKVIEEHEDSHESDIDADEERIVKGALTFSDKTVEEVMTPYPVIVSVGRDDLLSKDELLRLRESGHSRFPVYDEDEDNIVGMLYLRDLLAEDLEGKSVADLMDETVYSVRPDARLDDVLNAFLKTRHHLFIVADEFGGVEGLITVEDIMEEIVGREIVDEFDQYVDLRELAHKRAAAKLKEAIE